MPRLEVIQVLEERHVSLFDAPGEVFETALQKSDLPGGVSPKTGEARPRN
jgi:hypothetical protein